jgi:hypothetical protein
LSVIVLINRALNWAATEPIFKVPDALGRILEVTVKVVNMPAAGVLDPIAPGEAKVAPPRLDALIVPEPAKPILEPVPTTIAACVLVADVIALKATLAELARQSEPVPVIKPTELTCRH